MLTAGELLDEFFAQTNGCIIFEYNVKPWEHVLINSVVIHSATRLPDLTTIIFHGYKEEFIYQEWQLVSDTSCIF